MMMLLGALKGNIDGSMPQGVTSNWLKMLAVSRRGKKKPFQHMRAHNAV
jgi:hypothetical protein